MKDSTQEQFAKLVGISQPAVAQLIRKGVLTRKGNIVQWTLDYTRNLREQAAGRKSDTGADLIGERARLSKRQAERVEIDVARMRAELLPLAVVAQILGAHNSTIRNRCLGIPNALKSKHPELTTEHFLSLKQIVTDVLTELSHVRFPSDLDERIKQYFRNLHSAAESNSDGMGG